MKAVGTCAVNCTVELTVPLVLVTAAVCWRLFQKVLFDATWASKMFWASVTPAAIVPSAYMVLAALTPGDDFATAPTLAASAAAWSWERKLLARL